MNHLPRRKVFALLGMVAGALPGSLVRAQPAAQTRRAGQANMVVGDVNAGDASGKRALAMGAVVREGDTITTGAASEVHIVFDDGGMLVLRPSSSVVIDRAQFGRGASDSLAMTLLVGAMRSITGWVGKFDKRNYQLNAATATVGIRGTDHEVAIIDEGAQRRGEVAGIHGWVNEGATTLKNSGGAVDLEAGQAAWAGHNGQAPQRHAGIPAYLRQRRTRLDVRADRHSRLITEHIETRMRRRGLLKPGESLEDAIQRHQAQQAAHQQEHPARPAAEEANKPAQEKEREKPVRERLRAHRHKQP
jgi:hypothetical protein